MAHVDVRRPRLVRSRDDRWVAGVAGGIAQHLGVSSNAVRVAFVLGSFAAGFGIIVYVLTLLLAPLEDRVRSYIDSNCAHCHRPNGTGALWDARFDTPLAKQGLILGEVRNTFGLENGKVVVPGDPAKSLLHRRMASTAPAEQMPPAARNVADAAALDVIAEWIRTQASE